MLEKLLGLLKRGQQMPAEEYREKLTQIAYGHHQAAKNDDMAYADFRDSVAPLGNQALHALKEDLKRNAERLAASKLSIRQDVLTKLLDDIEAVTKARYYEDPNPIASPVEMFMIRDGREGGEAFHDLSTREKMQVLGDYTDWHEYREQGICFERLDKVFFNVIEGKPREQWLEGAGLVQPASPFDALRREIEADANLAATDEVRLERFRQRKEQGPVERPNPDIDMDR